MKTKLTLLLFSVVGLFFATTTVAGAPRQFTSSDDVLVDYEVPEWYQDAKLGYWAIYGLYSIPAYGSEWYGRWMYSTEADGGNVELGQRIATYHSQTYGDPAEFGYKDFVPMFTAEKFDADEWLDFCVDGGAKFFTMIGIFHDNYCMWDSETNPFNTMETTPNRDFVAELKEATKKRGLHFGLSNHSAWNGTFFEFNKKNGGDAKSPDTDWIYGTGEVDDAAVDRWWRQTIEMADKYQPDLYYFDWCWNADKFFQQKRRDFLSYYYNEGLKWNNAKYPSPEVVVNYKNREKLPYGSAVLDLERGGMSDIEQEVWQNDTSIGKISWSYIPDEKYRSANQIVDMLVDIVSKNGVLMLAFGPAADGSIPPYAYKSINEVGDWLEINGEAIYATRPWSVYGEGVTLPNEGMGGDEVEYVAEDVRFTRSKDSKVLYVTFLGYPGAEATVKMFKSGAISLKQLKGVELLCCDEAVEWSQDMDGLHLTLPSNVDQESFAYSFKLSFKGEIPDLLK